MGTVDRERQEGRVKFTGRGRGIPAMRIERRAGQFGQYDKRLKCNLIRSVVNGSFVVFFLPPGDCTHMPGAIEVARELLPTVSKIVCVSGDRPDVVYVRSGGEWEAFLAQ